MSSRHHGHHGGSSGTESKLEKEKTRLIQEKCQGMLNDMLRDDDNKYCVDCDAKGPRWASWNLGIFLCIRCAGIHRNLGVHISKVKSVNLDTWTPEQVMTMVQLGNSRARAIYEANLPDTTRRPQTDVALESFIRAKYEHKKYIAKEYIPTPVQKPNWDQEIEEMLKKKKKSGGTGTGELVLPPGKQFQKVAPKTTTSTTRPAPATAAGEATKTTGTDANATTTSTTNNNSTSNDLAGDLLGLTLDSVAPAAGSGAAGRSSDPFASPAKEPSSGSAASDLLALDSSAAAKVMSKDSIMSLYGKGGAGGMGLGAPPPQGQQQQQQAFGGLGALNLGAPAQGGGAINSLAGLNLNLNPFLGPAPGGYPQGAQQQQQAFGGGFGAPQQAQVGQQQFMFNNTGLGGGGAGMTSPQQQFQQFQHSMAAAPQAQAVGPTNPMMNQYAYPMAMAPNPYQQMQMVPGPPPAAAIPVAAGAPAAAFGVGRSPQQNFMFAMPTQPPLQSSPPNFLN